MCPGSESPTRWSGSNRSGRDRSSHSRRCSSHRRSACSSRCSPRRRIGSPGSCAAPTPPPALRRRRTVRCPSGSAACQSSRGRRASRCRCHSTSLPSHPAAILGQWKSRDAGSHSRCCRWFRAWCRDGSPSPYRCFCSGSRRSGQSRAWKRSCHRHGHHRSRCRSYRPPHRSNRSARRWSVSL